VCKGARHIRGTILVRYANIRRRILSCCPPGYQGPDNLIGGKQFLDQIFSQLLGSAFPCDAFSEGQGVTFLAELQPEELDHSTLVVGAAHAALECQLIWLLCGLFSLRS